MILFIEQATKEILSQGALIVILCLAIYLMYAHFKNEVRDLKKVIQDKDLLIQEQHKELSELFKKDIISQNQMTTTLNSLTEIIKVWTSK